MCYLKFEDTIYIYIYKLLCVLYYMKLSIKRLLSVIYISLFFNKFHAIYAIDLFKASSILVVSIILFTCILFLFDYLS